MTVKRYTPTQCCEHDGTYVTYSDYQKLVAENAALKAGVGFFAYSTGCDYEEFDTKEKAIDFATDEIEDFRGYACDGWSDEVGSVCWGVVMQRATEIDRRKRNDDDNCDASIEEVCDYTLLPTIETPATDAAIAEIKAQGVDELIEENRACGLPFTSSVRHQFAADFAANLRAGRKV